MDNVVPPVVTPQPPVSEQQQAQSQLSTYEKQFSKFRIIPQHEHEHRTMLIETTRIPERAELIDLITKDIELANIKDDKLLRIYQIQFHNIIEWYDMGLWENVGKFMYARMISELQLSRSKGGGERFFQGGGLPNVSSFVTGLGQLFGRKPAFNQEWEQTGSGNQRRSPLGGEGSQYG